jgi:exonuclease III
VAPDWPERLAAWGTAVRLLTLNVCHTGMERAKRLAPVVLDGLPDVAVLTEVRPGPATEHLLDLLALGGMPERARGATEADDLPYTVTIAARRSLDAVRWPFAGTRYGCAVLEVEVSGVAIVGLYVPLNRSSPRRRDHGGFWEVFAPYAAGLLERPAVLVGDWNTGSAALDIGGSAVPGMAAFDALVASGWTDAWRSRHPGVSEYSWHNPGSGNGFRLDHALLSRPLAPALRDAAYRHETRAKGISDHAALAVDLDSGIASGADGSARGRALARRA